MQPDDEDADRERRQQHPGDERFLGRNSWLAALDSRIRMTVEMASPTLATIRPNNTTLPSTTSVGRHFQGGTGSPKPRNARSVTIAPRSSNRMPRMRGK